VKTFAPGKLVLTGAYAVLHGAPAISVAVSRGAYADPERTAMNPTPEVRAALGADVVAPHVDASDMFVGARKLGLGASAAILVASLAAKLATNEADLSDPLFRDDLFVRARKAHADAQHGGSGVDIATSIHGGAIQYTIDQPIRRVSIPKGLEVQVFACATSARTSELRAEIDRFAVAKPQAHEALMGDLTAIANDGARAARDGEASAFVDSLRRMARSLAKLGDAAQIPIVPERFDELEAIAAEDDASFSVSGAGGGDVAVYVGPNAASPKFLERAHALGLFLLTLSLDNKGVRIAPSIISPVANPTGVNELAASN
jgi:phosphomevalonate kinase